MLLFPCNTSVEDTLNISVAQWEEVIQKKAQLEEKQKAAAAADEHRKQFLEDEINEALELTEKLRREDGCFGEHADNAILLCGCWYEAFGNRIQTECPVLRISLSLILLSKYFLVESFHKTNGSGQTWKGLSVWYLSDAAI